METRIKQEIFTESPYQELIQQAFKSSDGKHFVNILDVGDEALTVRVHLIRAAKKNIYLQTYIWLNDEVGRVFSYELIEAAKRGVKVKLLIDPWASTRDPQWTAFLSTVHPNLELKYFNPVSEKIHPSAVEGMRELTFHFSQVNHRMHNKIFIVDDEIGLTGGRNYQNDYYDRGSARNFKDRDALVVGPIVSEMTKSFMDFWEYPLSVFGQDLKDVHSTINRGNFVKYNTRSDFCTCHLFDELNRRADDRDYIRETFVNKSFPVSKIQFVADDPRQMDKPKPDKRMNCSQAFLDFMLKAKKSILAQTPYLVLDKILEQQIKRKYRELPDLDVIISTNSLATTDNIYTYSYACRERKNHVKGLRFRLFELKPAPADYHKMISLTSGSQGGEAGPTPCVHAKSFVVDDNLAWIGSFNFDPRSFYLNSETVLIIEDEAVAKVVKDNILRDIAPQNSWTVGKREKVPVVASLSGLLGKVMRFCLLFKRWPFCYTENFVLKEGKEPVPFYHKDFYDHYESVGPYPEVNYAIREIEVMLLKAFIGLAERIL